jgi:hypothetical protein
LTATTKKRSIKEGIRDKRKEVKLVSIKLNRKIFSIPLMRLMRKNLVTGEFCPGNLSLGEILPKKNSVLERGKNSVPSEFGKGKKKNFLLMF